MNFFSTNFLIIVLIFYLHPLVSIESEEDASEQNEEFSRTMRINERSESFNEQQLVTHLAHEQAAYNSSEQSIDQGFNNRRESFNENCLRMSRSDETESNRCYDSLAPDDGGSPFVSMPTIPAVYLAGDGDGQPLEKVRIYWNIPLKDCNIFFSVWRDGFGQFGGYDISDSSFVFVWIWKLFLW